MRRDGRVEGAHLASRRELEELRGTLERARRDAARAAQLAEAQARRDARVAAARAATEARRLALPEQLQGRAAGVDLAPAARPRREPRPMDRLIERGTVFDNAYIGSTPCMPARRDIYTGRLEFLERGWGPLEEEDCDLPRQVSGPPNRSIRWTMEQGYPVSCLLTDHFHLWEQGSGNYHMGYTGFEFVRGIESDARFTDPIDFPCPPGDRMGKNERHWRNVHFIRQRDEDYFCAQVCTKAADWLRRNSMHEDFYLHLDIFDPHEPWDPPEDILKQFDPRGYDIEGLRAAAPYAPWRDHYSEAQFENMRARYAAKVVFLDQWLGKVFDALDALDLWKDTLVVLTTDHGTWNGDHGRMGKLGTHQYDGCAHIPFITVSYTHLTLPTNREV